MKRLGSRWRNSPNNEQPAPLEGEPSCPLVLENGKLTIERFGVKPQVVNLKFLSERPDLGRVIREGLLQLYCVPPPVETVRAQRAAIRSFYRFLDWRDTPADRIMSAQDLTLGLLQEFGVWLNQTLGWEQPNARGHSSLLFNVVAKIKRSAPEDFDDLQFPKNLFPGASHKAQGTQPLALEAYRRILNVAHDHAEHIMQSYRQGDVPQSANEIIPFMIVIAARTAINASNLYDLPRDCLGPDGLDPHLFAIVWFKARAGAWQKYVEEADCLIGGAVTLIRFLLEFTAPLVREAAIYDKERLFLYRRAPDGKVIHPERNFSLAIHNYCKEKGCPDFTIGQVRTTAAVHLYQAVGGDLAQIQAFLQHKSLATTSTYLLKRATESTHARSMQAAQSAMIARTLSLRSTGRK